MGKLLIRRIGTVPDSFEYSRDDDFVGHEFKEIFSANCSVLIKRIDITFNDETLSSVQLRASAIDKDTGNKTPLFDDVGSGFYSWADKPLALGGNEYLGIETNGLVGGTPPGGKVRIQATIAHS